MYVYLFTPVILLLRTSTLVPIYDLRHVVNKSPGDLDQALLAGARPWGQKELPLNAYVCVHFTPTTWKHGNIETGGHHEISFTMLCVVILA